MKPKTMASQATVVLKPHLSDTVLTKAGKRTSVTKVSFVSGLLYCIASDCIGVVIVSTPDTGIYTRGIRKHPFSKKIITVQ